MEKTSSASSTKSSVAFQILDQSQFDEVVTFFYNDFVRHEPVSKLMGGIDHRCFERVPVFDANILKSIKNGLSWCAIEEETSELIGFILYDIIDIKELPDHQPTHEDYVSQGLPHGLATLFVQSDKTRNFKEILHKYNEEKLLSVSVMGVRAGHRGKGICSELVRKSIEYGVQKAGYRLVTVVASNFFNQKIFRKQGFKVVKEIKYAEYVVDGKTPLKDVEAPHLSKISFVKKF